MYGVKKQIKRRCSSVRGMRELLRHHKCINASFNPLSTCYTNAIKDGMRVIADDKSEEFFEPSCCFADKLMQCVTEVLEEKCPKWPRGRRYQDEYIRGMIGGIISQVCGSEKFDWESPTCKKIVNQLPILDLEVYPASLALPALMVFEKQANIQSG